MSRLESIRKSGDPGRPGDMVRGIPPQPPVPPMPPKVPKMLSPSVRFRARSRSRRPRNKQHGPGRQVELEGLLIRRRPRGREAACISTGVLIGSTRPDAAESKTAAGREQTSLRNHPSSGGRQPCSGRDSRTAGIRSPGCPGWNCPATCGFAGPGPPETPPRSKGRPYVQADRPSGGDERAPPASGGMLHRTVMSVVLGRALAADEFVCHRDDDKRNNWPDNLYLGDRRATPRTASATGRRPGTGTHSAKLSDEQVRQVRLALSRGERGSTSRGPTACTGA